MPPFTTPQQMGGGFTVDRLIMDSPRRFATQTQTSFFRNGVGSCGVSSLFFNKKKINKNTKKNLQLAESCAIV